MSSPKHSSKGSAAREINNLAPQPAKAAQHHVSCRPSDKDLVWHCAQCGLNESAEDVAAELERVQQQATVLRNHLAAANRALAEVNQQHAEAIRQEHSEQVRLINERDELQLLLVRP